MSADQLTELIEGLRTALRAADKMSAPDSRDYASALGVLQGRVEWAIRELERARR